MATMRVPQVPAPVAIGMRLAAQNAAICLSWTSRVAGPKWEGAWYWIEFLRCELVDPLHQHC